MKRAWDEGDLEEGEILENSWEEEAPRPPSPRYSSRPPGFSNDRRLSNVQYSAAQGPRQRSEHLTYRDYKPGEQQRRYSSARGQFRSPSPAIPPSESCSRRVLSLPPSPRSPKRDSASAHSTVPQATCLIPAPPAPPPLPPGRPPSPPQTFTIDTRPSRFHDFYSVPLFSYHSGASHGDVVGLPDGAVKVPPSQVRRCFNCNETGHAASDCTQPKNRDNIRKGAERYRAQKDGELATRQANRETPGKAGQGGISNPQALTAGSFTAGRDVERQRQLACLYEPGKVSEALRTALFWNDEKQGILDPRLLRTHDLECPWYKWMRKWGYPPGYLLGEGEVDPFDLVAQRLAAPLSGAANEANPSSMEENNTWDSTAVLKIRRGVSPESSAYGSDASEDEEDEEEYVRQLLLNPAPPPPNLEASTAVSAAAARESYSDQAMLPPLPLSPPRGARRQPGNGRKKRLVEYRTATWSSNELQEYGLLPLRPQRRFGQHSSSGGSTGNGLWFPYNAAPLPLQPPATSPSFPSRAEDTRARYEPVKQMPYLTYGQAQVLQDPSPTQVSRGAVGRKPGKLQDSWKQAAQSFAAARSQTGRSSFPGRVQPQGRAGYGSGPPSGASFEDTSWHKPSGDFVSWQDQPPPAWSVAVASPGYAAPSGPRHVGPYSAEPTRPIMMPPTGPKAMRQGPSYMYDGKLTGFAYAPPPNVAEWEGGSAGCTYGRDGGAQGITDGQSWNSNGLPPQAGGIRMWEASSAQQGQGGSDEEMDISE